MNNFSDFVSDFINESRKSAGSEALLHSEIQSYISKVNKLLPKPVQNAVYLTKKYNILSSTELDMIRNASKSSLKSLYNSNFQENHNDMPFEEFESLWKLLKDMKSQYKMLPQYLSPRQREAVELGKLSMNDLTIDLETPQGRNAAAKIYAPLMYKIVNQYVGKSSLGRSELISAALMGFTNAMNQWRSGDDDGGKYVSFKTYAAYRMQQQILNDINKYSHTISGNSYIVAKYGTSVLDVDKYDSYVDDGGDLDKMFFLASDEIDQNLTKNEKMQWDELYKLIESNFKQRDCDIFYRYFGLNGYKREKSKDIAKSMGMSEGNIRNSIINKMLMFLKKDRKAMDILMNLQEIYSESLMAELVSCDASVISETLLNDDIFIMLEDLTKWSNKQSFVYAIKTSLEKLGDSKDKNTIIDLLRGDFNHLDDNYKKCKKIIILFLSMMYPTESFSRKTDVTVLEYMNELQEYFKKYKL